MKKIIALIRTAIIAAAALFACAKEELAKKDILDDNGNKVATGYYDGDKLVREEKEDSKGNLTQKTEYGEDGKVEKVESYTLGTLFEVEEYKYGKEEGKYTKNTVTYNNKGKVVSNKETKYENGLPKEELSFALSEDGKETSEIDKTTYTYNEDGTVLVKVTADKKTVRESLLDKKGDAVYVYEVGDKSSVKTYYEKKLVSKVETYNKGGDLVNRTENEYNEDGAVKTSKSYNAKGELRSYSVYVYNAEGKLLGIYKYNADKTIQSTVAYDENGKATIHEGVFFPLGE